jgi:hypothetical protein
MPQRAGTRHDALLQDDTHALDHVRVMPTHPAEHLLSESCPWA